MRLRVRASEWVPPFRCYFSPNNELSGAEGSKGWRQQKNMNENAGHVYAGKRRLRMTIIASLHSCKNESPLNETQGKDGATGK